MSKLLEEVGLFAQVDPQFIVDPPPLIDPIIRADTTMSQLRPRPL